MKASATDTNAPLSLIFDLGDVLCNFNLPFVNVNVTVRAIRYVDVKHSFCVCSNQRAGIY